MSRVYLITIKDKPTAPEPVMGGFLVDANSPSQALRAITLASLDCEVASGLAVAQMLKAGATLIDARAEASVPSVPPAPAPTPPPPAPKAPPDSMFDEVGDAG